MDLKKMDPMARKLQQHTEGFNKALADGDATSAQTHLSEIRKFADYLSDDIHAAVQKGNNYVPEEHFAGNAAVVKFQDASVSPSGVVSGQTLPGFISSGRHNSAMRPHTGTFGRRVNQGE